MPEISAGTVSNAGDIAVQGALKNTGSPLGGTIFIPIEVRKLVWENKRASA